MPEDTTKGSDKKCKIKAVSRQKIISKFAKENTDLIWFGKRRVILIPLLV